MYLKGAKKKLSQFCRRLFQTHFVSTKYVFISNIYVANIWRKHTWSLNVNCSVPFLAYILVVLCYWCFILFSRYGNILVSASNGLSLIYIWCQWTRNRTNTTSPFHWEKSQWIRAFLKKYWKLFSSKLFLHLLRGIHREWTIQRHVQYWTYQIQDEKITNKQKQERKSWVTRTPLIKRGWTQVLTNSKEFLHFITHRLTER